ncbi:hypothetical protein M422DRAFT_257603 [Sphaerobolus stellatus SS14]|uniref:Uncharacterized protein n=1 Tax=Sphaerobolus stellatus (strain SS14) TaxID=990650 RepID=A0A0C9VP14_SPHS4|nr:hypothetical protein M422DRAFT_257603 [Sphaerobolus stellatus SS14]
MSNNTHGFLAKIPQAEPSWRPTAKVQTLDLPRWFDSQHHLKEQMESVDLMGDVEIHQFEPTQENESIAPSPGSTPSAGSLVSLAPAIESSAQNTPLLIPNALQTPEELTQGKKRKRGMSGDGSPPSYWLRSQRFKASIIGIDIL